jgi:exonuclease III
MIVTGWNCQGLKTSRAVLALQELLRQIKPDVIFLSESHLDKAKAEKLMRKAKFDKLLFHESNGRSGGLILMWKKEIKIVCKRIEKNFIDVIVKDSQDWRLTGFYGEPNWNNKDKSWEYIRELHANCNMPWLLLGDFNEILFSWEKEGGAPRSLRCMKRFQDCLSDCGLEDL